MSPTSKGLRFYKENTLGRVFSSTRHVLQPCCAVRRNARHAECGLKESRAAATSSVSRQQHNGRASRRRSLEWLGGWLRSLETPGVGGSFPLINQSMLRSNAAPPSKELRGAQEFFGNWRPLVTLVLQSHLFLFCFLIMWLYTATYLNNLSQLFFPTLHQRINFVFARLFLWYNNASCQREAAWRPFEAFCCSQIKAFESEPDS